MSLVSMNTVLKDAMEKGYAVPAFNVCNLEFAKAVIETANEMKAPVILSLHPTVELEYAGMSEISLLVKHMASNSQTPVVIHLDHGNSLNVIVNCIKNGFTSVMYDGSMLDFEENIKNTTEIVKIAHSVGVDVEAGLGTVGTTEQLTDPDLAETFVEKTNVDTLAIAIGNEEGLYEDDPNFDLNRLEKIYKRTSIPLVLHGGSGTPENLVPKCIERGIAKVNIGADLKNAFYVNMMHFIENNREEFEPTSYLKKGMEGAKQLIRSKFHLFRAVGKG